MKRIVEYIFNNFHYKLLAIIFAFLLWFLAVKQETVISKITIPLKIETSSNFYTISLSPEKVQIEVEGSKKSVSLLKEEGYALIKISPKFTNQTEEKITVHLNENTVSLYPQLQDITVKAISPEKAEIKVEKLVPKLVPVKIVFSGKFKNRYFPASVSPDYVTVYVPHSKLKSIKSVKTEPVDVDAISKRAKVVLKLISPYKVFPQEVKVIIERRRRR